jgi:chromosome segregation ATPase/ActR/RegA family two-component response regulator
MSNSVLIVEKDHGLMKELHEALQARGFQVEDTTDGKGTPELVRKKRPNCVVLAVDLDAGQNGYIICKKLKSDDELKTVPVIIIGDPKGFAQHQKLKTRADDYLGKPLEAAAIVDGVGKLIGFPAVEEPAAEADNSFDPSSMLEEVGGGEELPVDLPVEESSDAPSPTPELEEIKLPPMDVPVEEEFDAPADRTVVGFMMPTAVPPAARSAPSFQSSSSSLDSGEARELRAKVTELSGALDEAKSRAEELEAKVRELEGDLESKSTELETARASSGKSDNKEVFALRDAANKKDKEILRLKNELNTKEQEVLELREKENTFEQQLSEASEEGTKKDAQIKTLQQKTDQLAADRKKVDQQLSASKEEARSASAKLQSLQTDYDSLQGQVVELDSQLESSRAALADVETAKAAVDAELSEARSELDVLRRQLDDRTREAEEKAAALEQASAELDSTRAQLTAQTASFADEISGLRQRLADAEAESSRAKEKVGQTQARLKAHQEQAERLRANLQQAMDTLNEAPGGNDDIEIDELAEA